METADYSILPAFYRHRRIIKLSFNKLSALAVHTEAFLAQHCPVTVVLYLENLLWIVLETHLEQGTPSF